MKKPIVIIEGEEHLPANVLNWACSHSVPVIRNASYSVKTDDLTADYEYNHVIEYSSDITIDYLETAYCHALNIPAKIAQTDRLMIRELGLDDLSLYQQLVETYPEAVSDPGLIGLSESDFASRHQAYIIYSYHFLGYGIWGIFLKPELLPKSKSSISAMIGIAGIDGTDSRSLSYALFKEYQGKGYAFEACSRILEYTSETLEMDSVTIEVAETNLSSVKLAKKLKESFPELIKLNINFH